MQTKQHTGRHVNPVIDPKKLVFNADNKKEFLLLLKKREDQVQGMLLWCSIIVLVSYVAVVISIIKYYTSLTSGHPGYLVALLTVIMALLGWFIWLQYRCTTYQPSASAMVMKELLKFKAHVATRQLKLLITYIIGYSLIVAGSCFLCWWYVEGGPQKIIEATAPISIMVYAAGLFLLMKLAFKRRTYLNYIGSIDKSIIDGFSKQ
ncbi:hypothetical protein [Mucilaginibacter glaciei]|uniref:Uncharacterized protein n=1 Tax=Mucilaginibacter glaciei TaxID=2772109 RepID=A0A926NNQ4_9SPHI|nr:hypothetical protein [Mucilaginibacter glaciei]MBD1395474.1 hypothetical protein [Mucilaginibacter glaciei]